ncbi:MAG TPA: SDR family oxidoreductase [Actinomycetales bacterium]|nr:SDR family oxidoreductase [Actinomycetales bacterium]
MTAATDLRPARPGTTDELSGRVVVVAGATGAAGPAVVQRLVASGATVVAAARSASSLQGVVEAANADDVRGEGPGQALAAVVDLSDAGSTSSWATEVAREHGHVDGLVHLVGGWRGGKGITEMDLADWDVLHALLVRTLQHTTRAFHDALRASDDARLAIVSTVQVAHPTATNAAYAAAKAAAEAWTLAVADSFSGSHAAAVVLRIKALLTPAMREQKPDAKFSGYTAVADLAQTVNDLWLTDADDLNGRILCLT